MNSRLFLTLLALVLLFGILYMIGWISRPVTDQNKKNLPNTENSAKSECTGNVTPAQTEGPYYMQGSPERKNIADGVEGEKLTVVGFVFDKGCKPITSVRLDFWQADSKGKYDNTGYNLRGHQFTDKSGKYVLETIIPAAYESRPPHIHVKIRAGGNSTFTTQLYFPGARQNISDSIFDDALLMKVTEGENGKVGMFNFVLP